MMPNIYAIRNDSYKYQQLDLRVDDLLDSAPDDIDYVSVLQFSRHNLAMSKWWPTPDTEFRSIDNPNSPIPDICQWNYASLVLSSKAYRFLGDVLKDWGELLPITILSGETYYIFNCLTLADVKEDECEKSYYEGEELGLKTIVFDDIDVSNKLLYKTTINGCAEIFCGDRFKDATESFGLTGIVFSENLVENFT